ncbi:hypothetical protein [Hyphobacterium sp.]|uniref:hypothetical protein n=1 Tax=Hyphobacterium sp. TaxID=2004662 RepID=UPI003B52B8D9
MANVFIYIPNNKPYTDTPTGEPFEAGSFNLFDSSDQDELDQANRIIAAGGGFDVSELVSALIQISWANITGKPSTFTPSAHTHSADDVDSGTFHDDRISESNVTQHQAALALAIAQVSGLQAALDAKLETALKGAANGLAELDANSLVPLAQIPALPASQTTSGTFHADRIPDLDWSKILSTPTTLSGYGITDALTSTQVGAQIQAAIDALVDGAPGAIDTLNELAAALGDDPDFATTITNSIAAKLDASVWQAATDAIDGYMSKEDKAKLDGIESGATADQTPAEIRDAYESNTDVNRFTDDDHNKLDGIETAATANSPDATLLDRANHTGTQAQSTVDGLEDDLAAKVGLDDLPYASLIKYSSTDTTTDLADAGGATVQWNSALITDSAISIGGTNDTEISFAENGKYRVAVRLAYEDISTEGIDVDNSVGLFFKLNGVGTGPQGIGSVVKNTAGANEGQVWLEDVIDITDYANQKVTVHTQRLSGADELRLRSGESSLIVERVGGKSALLAAQQISDIVGLQDALDDKLDDSQKGVANGLAELDSGGHIPTSQIPASVLGAPLIQGTWNAATNTPTIPAAASGNKGHYYKVAVAGTTEIDGVSDWGVNDWIISNGSTWEKIDNSESVTSVAGKSGEVTLVKADVGLGNVDNTSDADKPVSTAQQTALDAKQATGEKGAANGYASLDGDGKVPLDELPDALNSAEVLISADATLNDATAPPGRLIRVKAGAAPGSRITLTIPDDRPQGWRRTILVSDGTAEFALGNNALEDLPGGDTAVITAGNRATIIADTANNLEAF